MTMYDIAQSTDARQWADSIAQQAYYGALARGQDSNAANAAAQLEWKKTMDTAQMTGMWNGQWSMPSNQWFTGQFGTWMPQGPQAGQETMAREAQTYGQQQGYGQLYGQYYAPGTGPEQGQQTLAAQQQANQLGLNQGTLTGWYTDPQGNRVQTLAGQQQQFGQGLQTQQEQRAAQAQGQTQAMDYMKLLASLRGPADWAKYQQVLGSTPNGMRDLVAAAAGQYVPGGGATTGMQPQAVSLQSMVGDISSNPYYGQGGGQLNMPNVYQGGQSSYGQQPQAWQNPGEGPADWQARMGQLQQYQQQMQQQNAQQMQNAQQPGYIANQYQPQQSSQAWGSGIGVGNQQPTQQQQQQGLGNGTNMPAPNQISAQAWKNMQPSQQQMMLGMYENQGWNKDDVTSLMNQSLPKYTSNAASTGSYKF